MVREPEPKESKESRRDPGGLLAQMHGAAGKSKESKESGLHLGTLHFQHEVKGSHVATRRYLCHLFRLGAWVMRL